MLSFMWNKIHVKENLSIFKLRRMCWDEKTSLTAWAVSWTLGAYLYVRNKNYDRWNGLFIICFTTIQLLEAGLWWSIHKKKEWLNELLTKLVLLALLLQPIVQSFFASQYIKTDVGVFITSLLTPVFFGIFIVALRRISVAPKNSFSSTPGDGCHLIWKDKENPSGFLGPWWLGGLYLVGLFLPLTFIEWNKGLPLLIVGILTMMYSLWVSKPGEFSSYWCFVSIIYGVVAVML